MRIIIITGLSGSGKTIALAALEDAGYYCVDNIPASLIVSLVDQLRPSNQNLVALVADSRSVQTFDLLPQAIEDLKAGGIDVRILFFDARDDILIRRFSETRRKHPLALCEDITLGEAIVQERLLLADLAEKAFRLDTSDIDPATCRRWVKSAAAAPAAQGLCLTMESFGFSHGIPLDADFVFDIRFLKNPHYDPTLRPLTGQDDAIARYMESLPTFHQLYGDILTFIETWLPQIETEHRSYLTIAVGCTGGRHRSVYMVEKLAQACRARRQVIVRHRSLGCQQWCGNDP